MAAAEADGDAPIAVFAVSKAGVVLKHNFLNAPPAPGRWAPRRRRRTRR